MFPEIIFQDKSAVVPDISIDILNHVDLGDGVGHKLIPSGDCEGFDPFGGGCPGHPIEDDSDET